MTERRRSPFGELVYHYRTSLNLTQADLAARASDPRPGHDRGTVSERTVQGIEKEYGPCEKWLVPRMSTVAALAEVFGLAPETAQWKAFVTASRARATASRPGRPSPPVIPVQPGPGARKTARVPRRSQPDFVPAGREPHLRRLHQGIARLVQGESGVMFVAAEPGTGKSALIAHACRQGVAEFGELVVLWGECASLGSAADPHQPFRQALGLMVGDTETASPTHIVSDLNANRLRQRVPDALAAVVAHGPGLGDRFIAVESLRNGLDQEDLTGDLATAVTSMLDAPNLHPGAQGLNEQVFRTLAAYAVTGPVVLVIEDVHWADVGTAALIFHLVRRLHEQDIPLLLIGSYRMSDLNQDSSHTPSPIASAIRESLRYYPDVVVDLSDAVGGREGEAFVHAVVERSVVGAPPDLAPAIFRQTGGLPLFVVALLDWYRSEHATLDAGDDALTRWLQSARLPVRLEGALSFLIDRLPANLQSLIAIASVQGPTFSADILQRVAGLTPTELRAAVDDNLYRRYQLVRPAGLSTTAGIRSHDYQFDHALLRDVLYHRLTDLERTYYHSATADAMVKMWGDGNHAGAARIAHHFARAGDPRLDAEYSGKAGNHALDLQDYPRARMLFDHIQDIGPAAATPFLVTQSLIGLGNCDRADGLLDDAESRFDQAIRLALKQDLPVVHANALTSMAMLDFDAGRMAHGTELLGAAVEVLIEFGDRHEACRSLALLSHTLHGSGYYEEAARRAVEAIDLAVELGNELLEASGMIALGNCWLDIGLFNDAIATYESCLDICRRLGNTHRAAICWLNISLASLELGSWERARAALAEVFALANRLNLRMIGAAHFNLALIEELTGNPAQAMAGYEASLRIREQVKQSALQVDCWAGLLRIALIRSEDRESRTLIEWIESYLEQNGLEGIEHPGRLHVTLVDAHGALNKLDLQKLALQRGLDMLRIRANLLQNPRHRHVYLHDVPPHRALIDRARSLGMGTDLLPAPGS